MVSNASEDLPEPDRPVNTTSLSRGISRSTFFRLCSRAPRMVMARVPEPAFCWRLALMISSMSAVPDAQACWGRHRKETSGMDANGCIRNVGRTRADFQCRMKTINGLLRQASQGCGNGSRWHARGTLARNKRNKKGRREAGLFED